ncbi:M48 family metallopeptidase [Streptomyces hirsutus]|uniref:M48 family metallopeptidase n=1 Tax=Streptomyces hirsutus TaxID=35620 RepID=UPI0036B25D5C
MDPRGQVPSAGAGPVASRSRTFLLPSATLTAFILLIVTVLAFTAIMQPDYYRIFTGNWQGSEGDPVESCLRQGIARVGGAEAAMELWAQDRRLPGVAECNRSASHPTHSQSFLINCGLLVAATGLHYWFRATSRARRRGVRPITAENLPHLTAELLRLADRAVPGQQVRFLIDLLDPAANGVAFGRAGRRYVLLGRGVLPLLDRAPEALEALVLHELAHIRNRDVDLTMITLGFLRAYALLVFAPVALGRLLYVVFGVHPWLYAANFAQMMGLALLLIVARAQVLRTREYQADARVVAWQGRPEPLRRLLAAAEPADTAGRLRASLRRLSGTHPTAASRTAALADPGPLMAPTFGFALVLGACLVLVWDPSSSPAAQWSYGAIWDLWRPEPLTVLLMMVLGLAVLRAALHWDTPRLHALRWGLALGLVVGMAVSPMLIANGLGMPTSFGIEAGSALLRGALVVLLVLWCEYLAAAWAPAVAAARRPLGVAFVPCAAAVAVTLAAARPVFEMHAAFILAQYDGTAMSDLPGPLLVFAVAQTTALALYFNDVPWLLGAAALLFGAPALGRLCGPRPVASPSAQKLRLTSHRAIWLAGGLTYVGLWWVLTGYLDVLWGITPTLLSDGMLVAGAPAAAGAAVAVFAPHPLRWAVITSVLLGLPVGALFAVVWEVPTTLMRDSLIFGVEGAFLAALAISGLSAARRPAERPGRRPATRADKAIRPPELPR